MPTLRSWFDSEVGAILPNEEGNGNTSPLPSPASFARQSILPPLPVQGPSPSGRSSSPRHHSSTVMASTSTPSRQRRRTSWLQPLPPRPEPADEWGNDDENPPPTAQPTGTAQFPFLLSDDQFFNSFADTNFSSPSTYPPLTSLSQRNRRLPARSPSVLRPLFSPTNTRALARAHDADSQVTSQDTTLPNDILHDDDLLSTTPDTSFSDAMPPSRKRRRIERVPDPRPSTPQAAAVRDEPSLFYDSDEDLFGESPVRHEGAEAKGQEHVADTIDLTEATEVPEDLRKPEVDKRIKLAAFQCVICMDDATTLTVTHCGHLYCAECLHSSLNVEATRGKCPMCRAKIDMKPRDSYTAKTKGHWPLELKLMTATRRGKRKAPTT